MGLSGSQVAYKQNRAGIARADSTRAGYYFVNHLVTINSVDRSSSVMWDTLRVTLTRNDEPDEAEFMVKPNAGFTPTAGQTVKVCLGTSANPVFAGQIAHVSHTWIKGLDSPGFRVNCTDWTLLFNRRRITEDFSGLSATAIALAVVGTYTSGFTAEAVESGMATIDEFICVNEAPMAALVRLANLVGGGTYVDARKIVHLWDSNGPSSPYTPTPPVQLTTSLGTLKELTPEYDYSQVRTRVIVEGKSASVAWPIPANADLATYGIPLDAGWVWFNVALDPTNNYGRIGTIVFTYDSVEPIYTPAVALVQTAAVPGALSVSMTAIGAGTVRPSAGWLTDGNGTYFYADSIDSPGGGIFVYEGIPASGYGSLSIDLPVDTVIYGAPWLSAVVVQSSNTDDIPEGEQVVVRAQIDDAAAQATIAALEGGDGIHEHFVSDERLSYVGCYVRAQAELDLFSASLLRASWTTFDMTAMPGAEQSINVTGVSGTVTIDSVTLTFPIAHYPPLRTCTGSTVKLASILDAIRG